MVRSKLVQFPARQMVELCQAGSTKQSQDMCRTCRRCMKRNRIPLYAIKVRAKPRRKTEKSPTMPEALPILFFCVLETGFAYSMVPPKRCAPSVSSIEFVKHICLVTSIIPEIGSISSISKGRPKSGPKGCCKPQLGQNLCAECAEDRKSRKAQKGRHRTTGSICALSFPVGVHVKIFLSP